MMGSSSLYMKPDINAPDTVISSNVKNKFGTQIINIRSTNPLMSVTIAGLNTPYSQIQCDGQVRYMISYFDFPGETVSLYQGEILYIYANISFVGVDEEDSLSNQVIFHTGASTPYNFIGIPFITPRDIVGDAAELAQYIQEQLSAYVRTQFQNLNGAGVGDPVFTTTMQLAYALRTCTSFAYDSASAKFGFVFDPTTTLGEDSTQFNPVYVDADITDTTAYLGYNVDFFIRVDPSLTALRQSQIAQAFGWDSDSTKVEIIDEVNQQTYSCYEIPFYGTGSTLIPNNPEQSLNPLVSPFFAVANLPYLVANGDAPFTGSDLFCSGSMPASVTWLQYAPRAAQIQQSDFVYVRCSLNTANWDQSTGDATNIWAILPWSRDFASAPEFNHVDQENFGTIESAQSLKHFTLTLTDTNKNLLTFIRPYILRIVIVPVDSSS